MPDLASDIELGASGSEVRYPLELVDGKLAYTAVTVNNQKAISEIAKHLPVEASWPHGTPGGMGEVRRVSDDSLGYMHGQNTNSSQIGVIRLRGKGVTSSAFTANVTDVPTFLIEEDVSGTKYIFAYNGAFGIQGTTDGSSITVNGTEKTFGGTCGKPAKFNGTWYIPNGSGADIFTLSGVAANTYTADASGDNASHFATRQRGAVQVMDFAGPTSGTDAYKLGVSTQAASYPTAAFEVGDSGTDITNIAIGASGTFVSKRNNLFRVINGIAQQITRFNEGDVNADYGCGLMVPGGSDAAYYNHGGLYFFNGSKVIDISPEIKMTWDKHKGAHNPPSNLNFFETAYGSDTWIYAVANDGSNTYIIAFRKDGDIHTPFTLFYLGAAICRGLIVDSGNRLWTVDITNSKFIHIQLGNNNQPTKHDSNQGDSDLAGSGAHHFFPETDFGYPNVQKQLRMIEGIALGLDANNTINFEVSADGASPVGFSGGATNTDGLFQRAPEGVTAFYGLTAKLTFALNGSQDPRLENLTIYANLRPDKAVRANFTIDTRKSYGRGAQAEWDGTQVLINLRALEGAAPTKFRDPGGTQDDAMVNSVTIRETFADADRVDYLLDVQVTSWEI